jgi:hypothetical protein
MSLPRQVGCPPKANSLERPVVGHGNRPEVSASAANVGNNLHPRFRTRLADTLQPALLPLIVIGLCHTTRIHDESTCGLTSALILDKPRIWTRPGYFHGIVEHDSTLVSACRSNVSLVSLSRLEDMMLGIKRIPGMESHTHS